MDRHDIPGATAADVARAHQEDLKIQDRFNCKAITYWFDETRGTAFCLVEAPDAQAVQDMHDNAHGLIPHHILQVESSAVEAFLGRIQDPVIAADSGNMDTEIRESALRCILCIDAGSRSQLDMITENTLLRTRAKAKISEIVLLHGGREVDYPGRKTTASFTSVSTAVDCAVEIQTWFSADHAASGTGLKPRIGLSAGAPVTGDAAFFGAAMRNASLLSDHAAEGEVLLAPSIQEHYGGDAPLHAGTDMRALSEDEQLFLVQLTDLAARVWNETQWKVTDYGKMLGMSKSQLYRKTITLTGCSSSAFIQDYRLGKAAASIETREGTVSEIAFAFGFSSLSYFSKCFKRKYRMLPSRYAAIIARTPTA
jgi:AraC-like DNA-binding protein